MDTNAIKRSGLRVDDRIAKRVCDRMKAEGLVDSRGVVPVRNRARLETIIREEQEKSVA